MKTSCQDCVFRLDVEKVQCGCILNQLEHFNNLESVTENDDQFYIFDGFCNNLRVKRWAEKNNIKKLSENEIVDLIKEENKITADIILLVSPNDSKQDFIDSIVELNRNEFIHNVIVSVDNRTIGITTTRDIMQEYCRYPNWQFLYQFDTIDIPYQINQAFKHVKVIYYGILKAEDYYNQKILPAINDTINTKREKVLVVENKGLSNTYVQSILHKKAGGFNLDMYRALAQEEGCPDIIKTVEDLCQK